MEAIIGFFHHKEWEIVHSFEKKERKGQYRDYNSLNLSEASNSVLSSFDNGIYDHQWIAINEFNQGANVCVSTSTSSGKTLIFNVCGLEILSKKSEAKILAVYPLKALGTEQESRWKEVISKSGLSYKVGRIDGAVAQSEREKIIKTSSIIIMTPDVIHAWLLSKVSTSSVTSFLKNISLLKIQTDDNHKKVILPNSVGLDNRNGRNEEFFIENIFYSPTYGLSYKGRHLSETSKRMTTETWRASAPMIIVPVDALLEIPGESQIGVYDLESGEVTERKG